MIPALANLARAIIDDNNHVLVVGQARLARWLCRGFELDLGPETSRLVDAYA